MFGEGERESIVQRGIDEALACQDVLERDPVQPSLLSRLVAWVVARAQAIAHHDFRWMTADVPSPWLRRWTQ